MRRISSSLICPSLLALAALSNSALWAADPNLRPSPAAVDRWQTVELAIDADLPAGNPFDAEVASAEALCTGPDGRKLTVPGFFTQAFTTGADGKPVASGAPYWAVRFTPRTVGRWTLAASIRLAGASTALPSRTLTVREAPGEGFITIDPARSARYPVTDAGTPFIAIGENIGWTWPGGYPYYFQRFAENGMNLARIWSIRWNLPLEWTPGKGYPQGTVQGLGRYALDNAWQLDQVFAAAAANGVRIQFAIDSFDSIKQQGGGDDPWSQSPYNKTNGGPCDPADSRDFFRNPEARRLFKRRLDYVAARFGASPALFAFEYFNEVHAPVDWLEEMSAHLRSRDPYGHPITHSKGYPYGDAWGPYDGDAMKRSPALSFTSDHSYSSLDTDHAAQLIGLFAHERDTVAKPYSIGEYGHDAGQHDGVPDPRGDGLLIHQGGWIALTSGSFANPLPWWWDQHIDPQDLYARFWPLSQFAKSVAWLDGAFSPLQAGLPTTDNEWDIKAIDRSITFATNSAWGDTKAKTLTLKADGSTDGGTLNRYLHGPAKGDTRVVPQLRVTMPTAGKLVLRVAEVMAGAHLVVKVDGKPALERDLPVKPEDQKAAGFASTAFEEQHQLWHATYNLDLAIDLPAGERVVTLENTGTDWLAIPWIRIEGLRDGTHPDLRITGQQRGREALVWIGDGKDTLRNLKDQVRLTRWNAIRLDLSGLTDGPVSIAWWDTRAGRVFRTDTGTVANGRLTLTLPPFIRDVAAHVKPR